MILENITIFLNFFTIKITLLYHLKEPNLLLSDLKINSYRSSIQYSVVLIWQQINLFFFIKIHYDDFRECNYFSKFLCNRNCVYPIERAKLLVRLYQNSLLPILPFRLCLVSGKYGGKKKNVKKNSILMFGFTINFLKEN